MLQNDTTGVDGYVKFPATFSAGTDGDSVHPLMKEEARQEESEESEVEAE